mmetsp:Transcript_106211/g.129532  ORF Transcript_106211/g.129532 Transcript_106211/m.129532 type:complete len:112 (+) Transcript_106211:397-732(+)
MITQSALNKRDEQLTINHQKLIKLYEELKEDRKKLKRKNKKVAAREKRLQIFETQWNQMQQQQTIMYQNNNHLNDDYIDTNSVIDDDATTFVGSVNSLSDEEAEHLQKMNQ